MTIEITGPKRRAPWRGAARAFMVVAIIFLICLVLLELISSFLVDWLWFPGLFKRVFVLKLTELQLEKPYIQSDIALTQLGYNLHQITAKPFPAEQDLTFKTLEANKATIYIRLWDWHPLMHAERATANILHVLQIP